MSDYEIISTRLKAFTVGQIVNDQDLADAGVDGRQKSYDRRR
jgi:hypothetical protein